ncbi:MAG: hypothetical protein V3V96_00385, partial [Acidiferrobacterales bacterium]
PRLSCLWLGDDWPRLEFSYDRRQRVVNDLGPSQVDSLSADGAFLYTYTYVQSRGASPDSARIFDSFARDLSIARVCVR